MNQQLGFIQNTKAWWHDGSKKTNVIIGFIGDNNRLENYIVVKWEMYCNELAMRICSFTGGLKTLIAMQRILFDLERYTRNRERISEQEFCEFLINHGIKDITPIEGQYIQKTPLMPISEQEFRELYVGSTESWESIDKINGDIIGKSYEQDMELWHNEFNCFDCGMTGEGNFAYERCVANGDVYTCKNCGKETTINLMKITTKKLKDMKTKDYLEGSQEAANVIQEYIEIAMANKVVSKSTLFHVLESVRQKIIDLKKESIQELNELNQAAPTTELLYGAKKPKKETKPLSERGEGTKLVRVARHLLEHGNLTSLEAMELKYNGKRAGIQRLAAYICDLKRFYGWEIETVNKSYNNENTGETVHYAKYVHKSGSID